MPSNEVLIEAVQPTAWQRLQHMAVATFTDTYGAMNTAEDMQAYVNTHFNAGRIQAELANAEVAYYFIYKGGSHAGYIRLNYGSQQTDLQDVKAIEIERIYVLPAFKGQGLGGLMIAHACQLAKAQRLSYVWLGVWEKNTKAIAFYQKMGFTVFDTHTFVLGQDHQTDLMMKRIVT